ncbi:MAG: DUF2497 domain-containing protein [Pseudomonadota bacterium]
MAQDSEASVEEILESIKKVIARDNRDGAMQARRRLEAEANEAEEVQTPDIEPIETETVAPDEDGKEVLDLAEMEFAEDVESDTDAWVEDEAEEPADNDSEDDVETPLIAENVRGAMQENLAALAMLAEPGAKPQIVRSGETSLEGLTRELLRPMLAEWLDRNLPGMVEKLVQAEIARIAGKKR